ncbi:hypothetical protein Pfo_022394 [Paulownia fortunei]|nr:hypothetical protein Pfo_022394 [Paulownia fortunei]
MFDILFGWRKASKCKKLIKAVQCRLKLLKNKRCCIVKQLREDVAELLKHGHDQNAFERVEQIIMDESTVQVYDLLDQFCEFILINLPYIRKHRDCPNDINEAASTLIFSSARFGELPELLSIRKLFGERYGQRFVMAALELLPGNLVNHQIKENLYITKVPDDVKYRLLDEIASSCIQPGPLFLEYKPELQEEQQAAKGRYQISFSEVQIHNDTEATELQLYNGRETEGKIMYVDLSSEKGKITKESCFGLREEHILPNTIQDSDPGGEKLMKPEDCNEVDKITVSHHESLQWGDAGETQISGMATESSAETSAELPEEMIYLDVVEEFVLPVSKDGNLQDQRLFMFKSFGIPLNEKTDYGIDINLEEQKLSQEKSVSRSFRKMSKASKKRSRRRSLSQENRNVTAIECATYYRESDETSPDSKRKSHYQRELGNKNLVQESRMSYGARGTQGHTCFVKVRSSFSLITSRDHNLELTRRSNSSGDIAKKCSFENPCYFYSRDKNEALESPCWMPKTEDFTMHSLKEGNIQYGLQLCKYSHSGEAEDNWAGEQAQPPPSRAITMPAERPKESITDKISRSNSYPFEQHHSGYSSCRHIHPKLPDYDELAEKFMALKRANLQNKQQSSNLQT